VRARSGLNRPGPRLPTAKRRKVPAVSEPLVRRDSRDGLCVASVRVVERDTVNLEPFAMLVAGHPV
jgi:hypothetical protein